MKRIILLFMAMTILFSLSACENETPKAEKYCWSCGGGIAKQAAFCEHCGVSVKESSIASTDATSNDGTEVSTQSSSDETIEPSTAVTTTPTTACNHKWNAATCTIPKTCEKCGLTEGKANGHWWHEATCTDARICTVCLSEDPDSEPLGHSFANGKCERCGDDDPDYDQLTLSANKTSLHLGTEADIVYITMTGADTVTYDIGNTDIVGCEWGDWDGDTIPLAFYPVSSGQTSVEVYIEGYDKSITIQVSVEMPELAEPTLEIYGVGAEYRLYYSNTLAADVFYLHSAEYEITYYPDSDEMYIEVEVIAETIENNVIDSHYIGIDYELRDDNGVCVATGSVFIDARYLNQKYSQIINFFVDAGDYTLTFKDMYM